MKRIAVTPGEPAGIGPDLVLKLALEPDLPAIPVAFADSNLLIKRAQQLNLDINIRTITNAALPEQREVNVLHVLHIPTHCPVIPGKPEKANAGYVLQTLQQAVTACLEQKFAALVTGPVHKGIINDAGIAFSGHTEYLAGLCEATAVMMLAVDNFRVALVTTHLPLSAVSQAITTESLQSVLTILHQDLINRFGIKQPNIKVAGLNPHAGESGHLGYEEIEIIQPVINQLKQKGLKLSGPYPADTLFTPKLLKDCDAVVAMYHDQGLPVLKYAGFGRAVNITLGLPVIRTSVDHGTALELAGTGQADAGSLITAFQKAAELTLISK